MVESPAWRCEAGRLLDDQIAATASPGATPLAAWVSFIVN